MAKGNDGFQILVVAATEMHDKIRRRLSSLGMSPVLVSRAAELGRFVRGREIYKVVLLPAVLPDSDWWAIWGELALLDRKPSILVYAQTASFELWSGVLEAGGYDVIVEPFTDEKLKKAVAHATECYDERSSGDIGRE